MRATHYFTLLTLLFSAFTGTLLHAGLVHAQEVDEVEVHQTHETGPTPTLSRERKLTSAWHPPPVSSGVEGVAVTGSAQGVSEPPPADPDAGHIMGVLLSAVLAKNWALAVVGGVMLLVLLVRKVGGHFWPPIATGKGSVVLTLVLGTLAAVLQSLLVGGNVTGSVLLVAAASGFWSWGQKLGLFNFLESKKSPPPVS